jgi:hypothetical protein
MEFLKTTIYGKSNYMRTHKIILLMVGMMLAAGNLAAQRMTVPANLQAAIFKKVLGFDKTLQARGRIEVAVVYGDVAAKDAIIEAFNDLGISAVPLRSDQALLNIGNATVVYVAPGGIAPKQLCAKNRVLSISGVSSFVESGQVSIGLSVEGGKPKILIHRGQLKGEGHELAEEILNMAKIIQ